MLIKASLFIASLLFIGCSSPDPHTYTGYIEAEYLNIASSQSGTLDKLWVQRGDLVHPHSDLFALECRNETLALEITQAQLTQAQALLNDARKGSRPSEIATLQAQIHQAQAQADEAREQFERTTLLYHQNALSQEQWEHSRTLALTTQSALQGLQAQLRTLTLGKREDLIRAQLRQVDQARAAKDQALWRLSEKSRKSPSEALVVDTLYHEGEWVSAGAVVVRLLDPRWIKIRFFVPQSRINSLKIGQIITFTPHYQATITYISPTPEYTPPLIYSEQTNEHLSFMIEARPLIRSTQLHPGQPVEVRL